MHRLDFETSGVVVFAKDKETEAAILNKKFDQWNKTYATIVMGRIFKKSGAIRTKLLLAAKGLSMRKRCIR